MRAIPTKLKIIRGNPGQRKLPENEPQPQLIKKISCPFPNNPSTKIARKKWNYYCPRLIKLGLLTENDIDMLKSLCMAFQMRDEAWEWITQNGQTVPTYNSKGEQVGTQKSTQVRILEQSIPLISRLSSKFGLSPSDRVGLEVPKKQIEMDELEKILNS